MKKLIEAGKWVGALGVIGSIIFMLKNNYEDRKEIERLDKESKFWKDAFKEELDKSCALEVEKIGVRSCLRRMREELNKAMVKSNLPYWDVKTLDNYLDD